MSKSTLTADEKIIKAKIQLNKKNPFFAYLLAHMKIKENSKAVPTMGVDQNGNISYNKNFVDGMTESETIGVMCHESLHVALLHMARCNTRDKPIFNAANDLAVNVMIKKNNFILPKGCLEPDNKDSYTFTGKGEKKYTIKDVSKKTSEELYEEIYKNARKLKIPFFDIHMQGERKNDEDKEGQGSSGLSKKEIDAIKKKWGRVLSEAYNYAKNQGKEPVGADRLIDGLLQNKMNWKAMLQKYITQSLPYDYTYSKPSKRTVSTGFYIPAIKKDTVDVACAIDTSGSISQEELTQFLSEIVGIAKSHENLKMTLIDCDADVHQEIEVANGNINKIMNMKPQGGGGTSHLPVFKHFEEKAQRPKLLIAFTDGYSSFPDSSPINTLWIITKGGSSSDIKFGQIVKCDDL